MPLVSKGKIVIVGFGWVGQANALALSKEGYEVYFYDVGRPELRYEDTYREAYKKVQPLRNVLEKDSPSTWYMVCVGDRVSADGEQGISAIKSALNSLKGAQGGVILRSTVLPDYLASLNFDFYVPEFLHEKKAVEECMRPHYFILGRKGTLDQEPSFFGAWRAATPNVFTGTPEEASYIKYLSNSWNALRIAFVNEFGNAIAHPVDQQKVADIEKIMDFFFQRKSYLRYGRSFGGHCLPKDTRAFYTWYKKKGKTMSLMEGLCKSNDSHQILERRYPHLPEWFSEWVRPQISGRVALSALKDSIIRRFKSLFNA